MSKKITLTLFTLVFVTLSFGCAAENTSNFSITGQITNQRDGKIVLSQLEDVNRKKSRVIGAFSINQNGTFDKDFDLEPHIYTINFYNKKTITLAIDKGQRIEIIADGKNLENIKISGSEDTNKFIAYEKFRAESLERLVKSVRKKISDLEDQNDASNKSQIEKLGVAEIENYEKHRDELNDFIKNKMGKSIAIYPTTLRWDGEDNIEFYDSLARSFEKEHPNLAVSKRINEKVEVLKNTSIGGKSAEIEMPTMEGEKIALSSIQGKFVLVDFWASWCGPCRRESKTVAELYKKYKDKGFEIYGVSLDSEKNLWRNALKKDERVWANVSTLQGFETPATFEYAVTALPAKFILDSEGKIVAKNLHGEELREKIESLFAKGPE